MSFLHRFTPGVWGQGYATELAQTAVTQARKYLPQWPVIARTRAGNIASMRTAERAGLARRPDPDTEHIVFAFSWTPVEDHRKDE